MHPSRTRRVLLIAFAISLIVHLIGAPFMRFGIGPRNEQPEFVTLSKKRVISVARATPHPIPTQMPTPVHTPPPRRVRQPVKPSHVATHASHGKKAGPPRGKPVAAAPPVTPAPVAPTPPPLASATPAGSCPHPEASPALAATPSPPDIAPDARAKAVSGTTAVAVKLDAEGGVVDTTIAQSSGNGDLDVVAVSMARNATYTPKYVACKSVPSDYTFTVRFIAW